VIPVSRPEGGPRLLVLRALGLGDLLAAVPALRALRRHWPGHELVLAAPARLAGVVALTGAVDRLLPTAAPAREVPARLDWTGPAPGIAVDLQGDGMPSHLLLRRLCPGRLLSYGHPGPPGFPGPVWRAAEHERERWCRLLEWHGVPADPEDLRVAAPRVPSPAPGAVVVHPGADAEARRWPAERFAAVAAALCAGGARVVVTTGSVLGGEADVPFGALAALVAHARAVVVGDTGLAHLASALGTPSVVLFGPVSPALWGPPGGPRHRVLWPHEGPEARPGDAHGDRPDERLLRITPGEVLAAVAALPPAGQARARGAEGGRPVPGAGA
jgi:ADP-heptose:LPS heptosyltransferase